MDEVDLLMGDPALDLMLQTSLAATLLFRMELTFDMYVV